MATSGLIQKFAEAIQKFEGWAVGSVSYRNNNPGNLKAAGWQGQIGIDPNGFAIFDNYADGWNALIRQITLAVTGGSSVYSPSMTITDFFERYAPSSDNNSPVNYANFVANYIGVSPDTTLSQLV